MLIRFLFKLMKCKKRGHFKLCWDFFDLRLKLNIEYFTSFIIKCLIISLILLQLVSDFFLHLYIKHRASYIAILKRMDISSTEVNFEFLKVESKTTNKLSITTALQQVKIITEKLS